MEQKKEVFTEICDKYISEIYNCAMKYFGEGIYVKSKDGHPCGWDFIDFNGINNENEFPQYEDDNLENYTFEHSDISNCCGSDEFICKTLREVIGWVGMNGWCFELSGVDYLE